MKLIEDINKLSFGELVITINELQDQVKQLQNDIAILNTPPVAPIKGKKKYYYTKCSKCGGDKENDTRNWCKQCTKDHRKPRTKKYSYSYSKCSKCGEDKNVNSSTWCKYCQREKYNQQTIVPVVEPVIIEPVEVIVEPVVVPVVKEKPTYLIDKGIAAIKKENPKLYLLIKVVIKNRAKVSRKELFDFIEPIIKRNHWATTLDVFRLTDLHTRYFGDYRKAGKNAIYWMYYDLAMIYKEAKSGFYKRIYTV